MRLLTFNIKHQSRKIEVIPQEFLVEVCQEFLCCDLGIELFRIFKVLLLKTYFARLL